VKVPARTDGRRAPKPAVSHGSRGVHLCPRRRHIPVQRHLNRQLSPILWLPPIDYAAAALPVLALLGRPVTHTANLLPTPTLALRWVTPMATTARRSPRY